MIGHDRFNITIQPWYNQLIEDLGNIIDGVVEARFSYAWDLIEGYHQIGVRILQESSNFERSQIYGEKIAQHVAESIGKSERTVNYAIQFAKMFPDLNLLPGGKNIHWRHIINKYLTEGSDKPVKVTPTEMLKQIKELLQTEYLKNHQEYVTMLSSDHTVVVNKAISDFIRYLQDQFNKITGGL